MEDIHKAQNSLFNIFDYAGNFRRATGKDGTQTYYSFSRNPKPSEKAKTIPSNHPLVQAIMKADDGDLDIDLIYEYMSSFEAGKEPEINIYDKVSVKRLGKEIKTTIGRLIINKIVFYRFWNNKNFPYHDIVFTKKAMDEIFMEIGQIIMEKNATVDDLNQAINMFTEFGLRLSTIFNSSITIDMMTPGDDFRKMRDDIMKPAFKEYRETHNMAVVEEAEKKVLSNVKEMFKDDDMMEMYESGASADINNDWKTMNVSMGSLPNLDGTAEVIVEDALADGIDLHYTADLANTAQKGAIDRGNKTALAGVLYKQLVNGFGNIFGIRGDCGSKKGIEVKTGNKWDILNRYAIVGGKSVKITMKNVDKFLNKKFIMRSPIHCKLGHDNYCSCCCGDKPFDIVGRDKIPIGIYTAEIATGVLNMFMKSTHDLHIVQFIIKDLNDFVYPQNKKNLFEIKQDPIDGITKVYCTEDITWRVPVSSIDAEYNYYNVLAYGTILNTGNEEFTLTLGTEVKTTPREIIRPNVEEDRELEAHVIFKYSKGDVFLIQTNSYMREMTTAKVMQLYFGGNVSNLIPIDLHLNTIYNAMKSNKKINAAQLSFELLLGTLIRDYNDVSKPAREVGTDKYRFISVYEVGATAGMFNGLFSNDANKALIINLAKNEKDQAKKISPMEKALRY